MTSRDDAVRAAVAPLLTDLRSDLLVMPAEHVVEQHLEMMALEERVLATPRFVPQRTRANMPRRALIAFICAFTTLVSCGLSAAGALPAPLQHITDSIAHTFGVPHAEPTPPASPDKSTGAPVAVAPAPHVDRPGPSPTAATPAAPAVKSTKPAATTHKSTATTTPTTVELPPAATPIATSRPRTPPRRIQPADPSPAPSNNSANTPPGFPLDWRSQAAMAAANRLITVCSISTTAVPVGCPQEATAAGLDATAQSVQWALASPLIQPYESAVVIAKTSPGNPAQHIKPQTAVTVYESFQMEGTYTAADGTGPYRAYSAGIGAATMTWDGSSFVNVSFSPGSVAGHLLPGVKPPTIPRPDALTNNAVLNATHLGFVACTAPLTGYVLTCPQTTAAGEQWTVTGDPTQGANVAYDATQGLYTVTGNYAMTSNLGNASSGPYTATLYFDGTDLQVLSVTAS